MARLLVASLIALAGLAALPARASADVTAFLGVSRTPEARKAKGLAFGVTLIVLGFELEYSDISEDIAKAAPGLRTGMANAVVQTPTSGAQLYVTAGAGIFRETYRDVKELNVGVNLGGGIKMNLLGPLRLRLDYRIFRLSGEPVTANVQRFYAGVNASF